MSNLPNLLSKLDSSVLLMVFELEHGFSIDGKSAQLGGDYDRELIVALRQWAQMIVTTVKTAEAEAYIQPKKPLILLSREGSGAEWLEASRLDWSQPGFRDSIANRKVLYETGLSSSRELISLGFIQQILIHHDQAEFHPEEHMKLALDHIATEPYYNRYISLFQRRGRG